MSVSPTSASDPAFDRWPELIDLTLTDAHGTVMVAPLLRHNQTYALPHSHGVPDGVFPTRPLDARAVSEAAAFLHEMVADKVNPFVQGNACSPAAWDFLSGGLVHELADMASTLNDCSYRNRRLPVDEVTVRGALPQRRTCTALLELSEGAFLPVMPVVLAGLPDAAVYLQGAPPRYRL